MRNRLMDLDLLLIVYLLGMLVGAGLQALLTGTTM